MWQKGFLLESEVRQKEERSQESEDINALIQELKQMQEHTPTEPGLLPGELNKLVIRISVVQESVKLKITDLE